MQVGVYQVCVNGGIRNRPPQAFCFVVIILGLLTGM